MVYTDPDFRTLIKDGESEQDCLLCFPDSGIGGTYFFGQHGAFEAGGATFAEEAFTNEYIECGSTLCRTMSVNLMNPDRMLAGFNFGKCKAYISVYYTSDSPEWKVTDGHDNYAEIDADHNLYYNDAQAIDTAHDWEFLVYDSVDSYTIYAFSKDGYTMTMTNGAYDLTASEPWQTATLVNGLRGALSLRTTEYTFYDPDTDTAGIWLMCPMGVYNVERPTRVTKPVIEITDAYDDMKYLDRDSSLWVVAFLQNNSSFTLQQFYNALCTDRNIVAKSGSFINSTVTKQPENFSTGSFSYRDYVYYIAEAAYSFARMDRTGGLSIKEIPQASDATAETLALTDIAVNSLDVQDISTAPITRLIIKWLSGSITEHAVQTGAVDNPYSIMGNPLYSYIAAQLQYLADIPTYHPISCDVIYADPSVEVGDMIEITDENDFIGFSPRFPLMSQVITWNGKTSARYSASGYAVMPADNISDTIAYNTYIAAFHPQVYNMSSIYGDGGIWNVMRLPSGFTIATSKQTYLVPGNAWTQWGDAYAYAIAPIHHHIKFDTVYGEWASPTWPDTQTGGSVWLATEERMSQLGPADDPIEFTHAYDLVRPQLPSGSLYVVLNIMIVGTTSDLP